MQLKSLYSSHGYYKMNYAYLKQMISSNSLQICHETLEIQENYVNI